MTRFTSLQQGEKLNQDKQRIQLIYFLLKKQLADLLGVNKKPRK